MKEIYMNAPVTDEQHFTYKETEGGVIVLSCTCRDDIIVLPETLDGKPVVNIASGLFTYNATGAKGIYVADTIEVIPENAFSNCGDLEVLVLGTGVKVIERASIVVNENLRVISVLSDSLEEMGTHVIVGCGALEEVRFNGDCENVGSVIGGWGDSSPVIYGPADSNIEQYAKEAGWEFMAQ